jgi:hypothetical protein
MSRLTYVALVMHLLDKYGIEEGAPLATYPNQVVPHLKKRYCRSTKWLVIAGLSSLMAWSALAQDPPSGSLSADDEMQMQAAEKFVAELQSIDWRKITQPELNERMQKVAVSIGWTLNDSRVSRYPTDKGLTTDASVAIEPASVCIKQNTWLKLLGHPIGVTLGDPFGFVRISTPEAVQKALSGQSTIASFGYRLKEDISISLRHQHATFTNQAETKACFHYLRILMI